MTPSQSVRKRFYKSVDIAERNDGCFEVQLDRKPIKTPAGRSLILPARALADAIAREWSEQGEVLVPGNLRLTKLANTAIDGVEGREAEVTGDILNYAASDLLCYRASFPAALVAEQTLLWDPILAFIRDKYNAPFLTGTGVKHVAQPTASLEAIRRPLATLDAFKLAALHVMTALTGSALIALAHADGFVDANGAWSAAHLDEDWQASRWGADFEATARREARLMEFEAASRFFGLS